MEVPMLKGCEITAVPLKEENNWRIDIDAIKQAIKPNTKCVVINFPHNPTGQVITNEESLSLISLLDKHGIWLFSDEVYRLLGNPSETWAKPIVELYHRGVSLGVMSKAFGLAGLRVGWIACQDQELLKRIEHMKHYTSICNSAPSEILTLIALKNMDRLLARNNAITEDNLKILDKFFTTYHDLFSWVRPEGGCVGLVKFKKGDNFDTFYDRLVKEAGVLLLPASVYDMPNNYFRIGFGRRNMPEALERFEKFLLL
jgi:aspartate/methionine/tyrosine aminotransferase